MIQSPFVFLSGALALSLLFLWLARWVSEEGARRAVLFREGEEAKAFLQRYAPEIEGARSRLSQWEQRTAGPAEARLIGAVTRFQRQRDDFRLVGLTHAPEEILLEAECRSQAAIDFLLFCDRELLDLVPSRIFLGCPPGTRVGSLRTEISFRPLRRLGTVSVATASARPEAPPLLPVQNPHPVDFRVRE